MVTDQAARAIVVLDPEQIRTYLAGRRRVGYWSWSADDDPSLARLSPGRSWTNPSEAKTRSLDGSQYLLTTASGGLAAVVRYPDGKVRWAANTGTGNVHSIELMPDGNVAVTSTTPGTVRLYTASQGSRSTTYTGCRLPGAHGVHWDPASQRLWALGANQLISFGITGTPASPHLVPDGAVTLPTSGGHDLAPVLTQPGRLWVTTSSKVYLYDLAKKEFVGYPDQASISRKDVKSISDEPVTRQVLTAIPEPGNLCGWCTSTLTFHSPDYTRRLDGIQLYKARWWTTQRR
ncbi:DUF6528 family protein [Streptomyces sp. NPDC003952]